MIDFIEESLFPAHAVMIKKIGKAIKPLILMFSSVLLPEYAHLFPKCQVIRSLFQSDWVLADRNAVSSPASSFH